MVVAVLFLVGCGTDEPSSVVAEQQLRAAGFQCRTVVVDGDGRSPRSECLWVADTPELQGRGLTGVDDPDLGGRPGMVFPFDPPVAATFWMRDASVPLTLVWVGLDGRVLGTRDMEPCADESGATCARVSAPAPLTMALEVPRGRAPALGLVPGASVSLGDPC